MAFPYDCPYCGRATTIVDQNMESHWHRIDIAEPVNGDVGIYTFSVTCPNRECRKLYLEVALTRSKPTYAGSSNREMGTTIEDWKLLPSSAAKIFPDYVPEPIREDYYEACKIRDLSAKAAATLARRALQGMIRDFWGVTGLKNLKLEVDALQSRVDPITWKGIDAIRSVGNIGAHMEGDINIIVDVEPDEAQLLISLIERLEKEWYEERKHREDHLLELEKLAQQKQAARKPKP